MKKVALVCVIDDDNIHQFATKRILEGTTQVENIIQFPDGEQALEYFIENKDNGNRLPELVFLDINMPFVDGWQFLDKFITIKFNKELITIYIASSSNSSYDMNKFHSYPELKGFLIKPIKKAEIQSILNSL
jgi:two-component system, chemotaxis family, chemotaxis protein CheY